MKLPSRCLLALSLLFPLLLSPRAAEVHERVRAGDLAGVRELLENDLSAKDAVDGQGRTPLSWAARGSNLEIVTLLLEKGADPNARDGGGATPLHVMAYRGFTEGARVLLAKGADVEATLPNRSTALHLAVLGRRAGTVRFLVESKADRECRDAQGRTPLILAAREMAGAEIVRLLLDLGAKVDATDRDGSTALSLAAWRGTGDVVELLLQRGATLPVDPAQRKDMLSTAVETGLAGLFARLVALQTPLDIPGENGGTLLHPAAAGGACPIVETLLAKGLPVNQADGNGWTPLHFAADMGRTEALELLLAKGADLRARNRMGQTAADIARDNADGEMMAQLARHGLVPGQPAFPELRGPYLGQKPPGRQAEVFAPGIVSGRYGLHSNVTFSPDGNEAFWSVMVPARGVGYSHDRALVSRLAGGRWTCPEPAVLAEVAVGDVPFFHPDGTALFDMSARPFPDGSPAGKENIWHWKRGENGWQKPAPLPVEVNGVPLHWQFGLDRQENVYYSTAIPGSRGGSDLYVCRRLEGGYARPENLGAAVNSPADEGFPFVTPDGNTLLFERGGNIYASFRGPAGHWSSAMALGPEVNTPGMEILPSLSPDRRCLFFSRDQKLFWIDAAVLDSLRRLRSRPGTEGTSPAVPGRAPAGR